MSEIVYNKLIDNDQPNKSNYNYPTRDSQVDTNFKSDEESQNSYSQSKQQIFNPNVIKDHEFITSSHQNGQNHNNLKISGINLNGCDLLRKETFHFQVVDKLQKQNPNYGLLQILLDQRIVVIKKTFSSLRKFGLTILLAGFILWLTMTILYSILFNQHQEVGGGSEFFIIFSQIEWLIGLIIIYIAFRRFQTKLIFFSQFIISQIALVIFIIFCVEASSIGAGYNIMIILQLIFLSVQTCFLYKTKKEMDDMLHLID